MLGHWVTSSWHIEGSYCLHFRHQEVPFWVARQELFTQQLSIRPRNYSVETWKVSELELLASMEYVVIASNLLMRKKGQNMGTWITFFYFCYIAFYSFWIKLMIGIFIYIYIHNACSLLCHMVHKINTYIGCNDFVATLLMFFVLWDFLELVISNSEVFMCFIFK